MKPQYSMEIRWSDKDEAYLVYLPEFAEHLMQPCTHGETYQEAAEHGLEVMQEIIEILHDEKKSLPVPKIHQDFDVEAA
jgi:antitoxin HicB